MARANAETRSDASQRLRSSSDNFFADAAVVGAWTQFWGREGGPIRSTAGDIASLVRRGAQVWGAR
jgi:hypothetical protein